MILRKEVYYQDTFLFNAPQSFKFTLCKLRNMLEGVGSNNYPLKENFFKENKLVFKHLDIIEFNIKMPRFPIFFGLNQITIPETNWILKVLISEN